MAGIYLHIPFCKTRCIYCDFYTGTDESEKEAFAEALCTEIRLRRKETSEPVKTVYWGGGTPSRLNGKQFERIFNALFSEFPLEKEAEITLEANPDDLSPAYIDTLARLPFNRISIGTQSFNDKELKFLSRRHSAQQAVEAVELCREAGFRNISLDLMYGLPNQTLEIWRQNLRQTVELNIPHVSAYHLIYEEKTKLYKLLRQHKIQPVSDELSIEMFSTLIDTLTQNGFEQYEISNFAKDKNYSKHNTSYWKNEKYLGLGPAAHSFDGDNRSWNAASLATYIETLRSGKRPLQETERLTLPEKYNECILTGLRTAWGVDLEVLKTRFGEEFLNFCLKSARKYIDANLLKTEGHSLKLTRKGIFVSDGIMSELMRV